MDLKHETHPVENGNKVGFGPFVPHGGEAPKGPSHPLAMSGMWMALGAIMKNFDSTNGLSMAWDDFIVTWGQKLSKLSARMSLQLNGDYNDLVKYVNEGHTGDKDYTSQITQYQLRYQVDQTKAQNSMQGPQGELDKQTQTVKDLGTVTQQGLQNAQSILGISSNVAQDLH